MKRIGLIGGMSWESTAIYYRLINEAVACRRGGHHSAALVMVSLDFAAVETMQRDGDWDAAGALLADAARSLERGGAELIVLCTNTMHRVAEQIEAATALPFVHIADATAAAVRAAGLQRVGLLGTRYTMEADFYSGRLVQRHGLEVLVPRQPDRELVHRVIYEELTHGRIEDHSRGEYARIGSELVGRGAECLILGCTEIGMLVGPGDFELPVFDTTEVHALAAVAAALGP
ncbi:MAG: aspartate/glutamate racemase family protein [Solirubrobacterales bacterium]